jgi:hypothetical protein
MSEQRTNLNYEELYSLAVELHVDFLVVPPRDLYVGYLVEAEEHGPGRDLRTDVTHDDPLVALKIALAHMMEAPDYYVRLKFMEQELKAAWPNPPKIFKE